MKIFLAGATGATGRVFEPMATRAGHALLLHVRPQSKDKTPLGKDPRACVFDLTDPTALDAALAGCDAVVSLVGTMQKRFAKGDTYESSDIATTNALVDAAKRNGVPRFVLLSSVGAGGPGTYLKMKAECERFVIDSGLQWAIVRPSMLVSPSWAEESHHGARNSIPGANAFFTLTSHVPGLRGWSDRTRPIGLDVVSAAILDALGQNTLPGILEGDALWKSEARAKELAPRL